MTISSIHSKSSHSALRAVLLGGAMSMTGIATLLPATGHAQTAPATARFDIDIAAQPLPQALTRLSQQTRVQIAYTQDISEGLTAPAVKGRYTYAEALDRLLIGSGLSWREVRPGVVTLERASTPTAEAGGTSLSLGTIRVEGAEGGNSPNITGTERDAIKADNVYDLDQSTAFADRQTVERYKGVSAADTLKGLVGVYSRDARNSGAIDPSIRGMAGSGRVPVIIDGTEQALAVNRGYNGVSHRSYLDPNLIAGVQVFKGPGSGPAGRGSVGGAVVLNTLDASDILSPDQNFGLELKIEGANNTTKPRLPTLLTGQDYRTVPGFPGAPGTTGSPSNPVADPSLIIQPRTEDDNKFLSLNDYATRLAVAGRSGRFNWLAAYAYRRAGNYFVGEEGTDFYDSKLAYTGAFRLVRRLAEDYVPGREAPNSSSELTSWLLKGGWQISDDQYLLLTARDSRSTYGEIMPSRIVSAEGFGTRQWPLSHVHAKSTSLEYKWQPDSRWIDVKASVWNTRTASATYSAGGFPNYAVSAASPIIRNTALTHAQSNRTGVSLSNRMSVLSNLDLTLAGNWQREHLTSPDTFSTALTGWQQYPRAGRREEYDLSLSFDWQANRFLSVNGGARYSSYWAFDDFLESRYAIGDTARFMQAVYSQYLVRYRTQHTGPEAFIEFSLPNWQKFYTPEGVEALIAQARVNYAGRTYTLNRTVDWFPNADGKYVRADDPCLNGTVTNAPGYVASSCTPSLSGITFVVPPNVTKRADGWTPWLSTTFHFTGNSRAYVRYDEAYRYPGVFESTVGFSASLNPKGPLKPEHTRALEVAYIHDLRDLLKMDGDQRADVKLTWYRSETKDVIERDLQLKFSNMEQQNIEGVELQARYDNGRLFTDFSAAHTLKNEVCDPEAALMLQPKSGIVPDCVKYGFVSGYMLAQATPDTSANWTIGGRFLNRRLETGARFVYYSAYDNPQLETFIGNPLDPNVVQGYALNMPYSWGRIFTADAYASYAVSDKVKLELVGTNLTDRYYLDPLSRSLMPAPGRTFRFSVTARY